MTENRNGAAQHATTTIPIVFIAGGFDPIEAKMVSSLARPGGNITGLMTLVDELSGKRLSLFKEAFPHITRVALLVEEDDEQEIVRNQTAASALGLSILPYMVHSSEEFERAFNTIADARSEGIVMPPSKLGFQSRALVARWALMRRLPLMVGRRTYMDVGALMSYGPDTPAIYHHAAVHVDKILKGKKPADLPVELPMKYELVVNPKTAETLGITIPQSILFRADEVIE
jgi:putative ABC transport system substrate-binding protein